MMLSHVKKLLVLVLVVAIASTASAKDGKKKGKGKGRGQRNAGVFRIPKKLNLTDSQKQQVQNLRKKYSKDLATARQGVNSIITAEQRKARSVAVKKARAAGKKGKEVRAAANSVVKLTNDQKAQLKQASKKLQGLNKQIRGDLLSILTDEQKAQLKKGGKKRGGKKKPGNKRGAKNKNKAA